MHYCTECGWSIHPEEAHSIDDSNKRAIQHYLNTEHMVVRQSSDRQADNSRSVLAADRL
jgi:hypothetical protein